MKVGRIKNNNKKEEIKISEEYSVKQMVIIIVILLVIFGIFYLITSLVVGKKVEEEPAVSNAVLDSTKITIGHLLDRKEKEYYVLATKDSTSNASITSSMDYAKIYNSYITDYQKEAEALAVYNINLDDALNKNYIGDELNITNNVSELKINDDILFKIRNGKIYKYYVGNEKIIKVLSDLKES